LSKRWDSHQRGSRRKRDNTLDCTVLYKNAKLRYGKKWEGERQKSTGKNVRQKKDSQKECNELVLLTWAWVGSIGELRLRGERGARTKNRNRKNHSKPIFWDTPRLFMELSTRSKGKMVPVGRKGEKSDGDYPSSKVGRGRKEGFRGGTVSGLGVATLSLGENDGK